jgi:UDP-glucuronate decarboxylase
MHPNNRRVDSNFVMQALRGEPITIFCDGSQTRSFCHVSDLVDGLVRLMESPAEVVGPINLGNPVEATMRLPAEQVVSLTGSASTVVMR